MSEEKEMAKGPQLQPLAVWALLVQVLDMRESAFEVVQL